ncbi:hypothetical protein D3C77_263350 [compost metagenome]
MTAAAADDDLLRLFRAAGDAEGHGLSREGGQGGGRVLQRQRRNGIQREVETVQRLRSGCGEVGMGQIGVEHDLIDRSRRGQAAALVHALLHAGLDQQVDHAVGGAGVEGLQPAVGADQGDVADPAKIQDGDRPGHPGPAHQGRVIDGR